MHWLWYMCEGEIVEYLHNLQCFRYEYGSFMCGIVISIRAMCQLELCIYLLIGCCFQKCPFEAITIINLPSNLEKDTTHRYGTNSFKLHRLPTPRPGDVLGLVGTNGIGKSTALKILAGKLKPNLGKYAVSCWKVCKC